MTGSSDGPSQNAETIESAAVTEGVDQGTQAENTQASQQAAEPAVIVEDAPDPDLIDTTAQTQQPISLSQDTGTEPVSGQSASSAPAPAAQMSGDDASAPEEQEPEAADSGSGGLLDWLTGGNDGPSQNAETIESTAVTENTQASQQAPESAVIVEDAADPDLAEIPKAATESDSTSGGFLNNWFTNNQQDTSEPVDEAPTGILSDVEESSEPETEPAPESSGFLAGLGALFGGAGEPRVKPAAASTVPDIPESEEPALVQAPPADRQAPEMLRRKNARGNSVTVLKGPHAPPPQAPAAMTDDDKPQVLSGEGSRIQALLDQSGTTDEQLSPQSTDTNETTASLVDVEPPTESVQREMLVDTEAGATAVAEELAMVASAASVAEAPVVEPVNEPTISPETFEPPLPANPDVSQAGVTQLALSAAPARAVNEATATLTEMDLSHDDGLAGAVVKVISAVGSGAGVVINDTGHILTNWHLVRGHDRVAVAFKQTGKAQISSSQLRSARILRHSKYPDLALLAVDGQNPAPAAKIATAKTEEAKVVRGARLHTLHLDDSGGWQSSVAAVERVRSGSSWYSGRRVLHRATVIRAEMEGQPGLSGVPLFNQQGEIAGLTTQVKADKKQLIAVSVQTLQRFLKPPE